MCDQNLIYVVINKKNEGGCREHTFTNADEIRPFIEDCGADYPLTRYAVVIPEKLCLERRYNGEAMTFWIDKRGEAYKADVIRRFAIDEPQHDAKRWAFVALAGVENWSDEAKREVYRAVDLNKYDEATRARLLYEFADGFAELEQTPFPCVPAEFKFSAMERSYRSSGRPTVLVWQNKVDNVFFLEVTPSATFNKTARKFGRPLSQRFVIDGDYLSRTPTSKLVSPVPLCASCRVWRFNSKDKDEIFQAVRDVYGVEPEGAVDEVVYVDPKLCLKEIPTEESGNENETTLKNPNVSATLRTVFLFASYTALTSSFFRDESTPTQEEFETMKRWFESNGGWNNVKENLRRWISLQDEEILRQFPKRSDELLQFFVNECSLAAV